MPAGLPNTVAASFALAARPADAVPRSGVPISYIQKPADIAGARRQHHARHKGGATGNPRESHLAHPPMAADS